MLEGIHLQVHWDQDRFDEIKNKLSHFLNQVGFKKNRLWFVPTSGYTGENLVKRTNETLNFWYKGPTLVEQIGEYEMKTERHIPLPKYIVVRCIHTAATSDRRPFSTFCGGLL